MLKITGDKTHKVDNFVGFALEPHTLSANFSLDSFVATLARLTGLRVLLLASLGIWGSLPDKIHQLSSLEYLDLNSNYLFGSIPPKISTMARLETLDFGDNFINDTFPDWFDSLPNLTYLRLNNNKLKGKLPNLDSLQNLQVLYLNENRLHSKLPPMPKRLVVLNLNNNSFSGEIPSEYTRLTLLDGLVPSFNELTGTIPAALFRLPNMSALKLDSNMLTGSLPDQLRCSSQLYANVSYNFSTGRPPYCLKNNSDQFTEFDWNCMSVNSSHQRPKSSWVSTSMPEKNTKSEGKDKSVQDNLVAGFPPEILNNANLSVKPRKLNHEVCPFVILFTLRELKEATNNFDRAAILGEGTYGPVNYDIFLNEMFCKSSRWSQLYKGRLVDGSQVGIRCITASKKYTNRNLKLKLDLLTKLHHPNLVRLLGHCIDGDGGQDGYKVNEVFLIYEHFWNGKLSLYLHEDNPGKVLNWSERLEVLISIAEAVKFLHTGVIQGFFDNRLKTNNILLNEHGIAKLSDYGLSIISQETENSEEGEEDNGTWKMERLEDNVYSFGFIMLESLVVSSMSARRDTLLLDELVSCVSTSEGGTKKMINAVVLATCSQESLSVVIGIAKKCILESWNRPSFEDIIWNLKYAAEVQATADSKKV